MSQRTRNPFKLRASEKIESDSTFLRLYSPVILEDFEEKHKEQKLWDDLLFIRSSPGAGKSSLLRLFEPVTLVTLFNNKSNPVLKDLREYLKRIDVMDNAEIKLLGVSLQCNRNYEILEDLTIDDAKKKRFFFALINSRIVLASLRGILSLKGLRFPEDLTRIRIDNSSVSTESMVVSLPCTGDKLYRWAEEVEGKVYKALDSFLPIEQIQPEGHSELFTFELISRSRIFIDAAELRCRILFMFDDTHKLSRSQREFLLKYIIEKRANFNIWIAERLEALSERENLRSFLKRDYNEINLEGIWQKKESKFRGIVSNIAYRRAQISTEDVPEFDQNLADALNEAVYRGEFERGFEVVFRRMEILSRHTRKFVEWTRYLKEVDVSPLERLLLARSAEILLHKNLTQQQITLDLELSVNEFIAGLNSTIQKSAEYFVCQEFKLPYYYGLERVIQVSSCNIDQFLQFSSELYEGMLSNRLATRSSVISAEEQQKIIRRVVNDKWNEMSRLIPFPEQVKNFLQKFHEYALKETNRPTIPYAPGVTGFALKEPAELKLLTEGSWLEDEIYRPLVNVLSTCVSFNLLEKREINQGKKGGDPETVFYLNRWLCVRFNLPFGYGGWRHIKPGELLKWTKA